MVYLDEYGGEDGTYFDVGEQLVMPHELHEALEQEVEVEEEEGRKEERKDQLRRKEIKRLTKKAKQNKNKIDYQENQIILDANRVLALNNLPSKMKNFRNKN